MKTANLVRDLCLQTIAGDRVFALILGPKQPGPPRLLPLCYNIVLDYRQKNPLKYSIPGAVAEDISISNLG